MPQIKRIADEPDKNELLICQNFAVDPGVLSRPDDQNCADNRQQCPPTWETFGGNNEDPTQDHQHSDHRCCVVPPGIRLETRSPAKFNCVVCEQRTGQEFPEPREWQIKCKRRTETKRRTVTNSHDVKGK